MFLWNSGIKIVIIGRVFLIVGLGGVVFGVVCVSVMRVYNCRLRLMVMMRIENENRIKKVGIGIIVSFSVRLFVYLRV